MASRISSLTSFSGRWSLISWCVRKPRVLPILMRVLSSWRRLATSSSVSVVSSRPNSRISARSLARLTFMRSGLALAFLVGHLVGHLDLDFGFDLDFGLEVGLDVAQVFFLGVAFGRLLGSSGPSSWRPCPWVGLAAWPSAGSLLGGLASASAWSWRLVGSALGTADLPLAAVLTGAAAGSRGFGLGLGGWALAVGLAAVFFAVMAVLGRGWWRRRSRRRAAAPRAAAAAGTGTLLAPGFGA
jgi:hypothetical protein